MARQNTRRRTSTRKPKKTRRKNRWLWIPKLILLAACVGLALLIGFILVVEKEWTRSKESRRTGIFETETPNTPAVASSFTPGANNSGGEPIEEVSPEERRELEALLK